MKQFNRITGFILTLIFSLAICVIPSVAQTEDTSLSELLSALPQQEIQYTYTSSAVSNAGVESSTIFYSHALLLQDATIMSAELSKVSVALAMASYNQTQVTNLVTAMDFTVYDEKQTTYVYERSTDDLTLEDNDYVAYTIAYKELVHPLTGETHMLYCVPIKGTSSNGEWFSNFNLGAETEHEGFRKAASEIYDELLNIFSGDGVDSEHRIVWVTGHSRGASCANLVAGWLSSAEAEYTVPEHVFGYTFACPAVSLDADTTMNNIYNFNNPGDLITQIPMKDWGYQCYGQTIELDTSSLQFGNVKQRFESVAGDTYAGLMSGDAYETLLLNILGDDREIYYDSASLQLTLGLAAYGLGGHNDAKLEDIVEKYMDAPAILYEIAGTANLATYFDILVGKNSEYDELAEWTYDAYLETCEMSDEEFSEFLAVNKSIIEELESESEIDIVSANSFLYAYDMLNLSSRNIVSVAECIEAAMELICDDSGNVMDKIKHAHCQAAYTVWINSMYYGDSGWAGNEVISSVILDGDILTVGSNCFNACKTLTDVEITDCVWGLGSSGFKNCTGLTNLTISVDLSKADGTFSGCNDVSYIHYTPGRTGVLMDRTADNYYRAVECIGNIESVVFEEGITYIGNCAFYNCSMLTDVTLPESLISIGSQTFYNCSKLKDIILPEGLTSIGSWAFENCDGLTQMPTLPSTLTEIPLCCFYDCDSLKNVVIPDHIVNVGHYAFYDCDGIVELTLVHPNDSTGQRTFASCDGLRTVTLPVDAYMFDAFEGTNGVTTIHYTYGTDGIMEARSTSNKIYLEYCSRNSITSIDFEEGITHIGDFLFCDGSSSLTTVSFPSTLESIGRHAFYSCTKMENFTWPNNLSSIGHYAFYNCDGLTSMTIPNHITSIGWSVFADCDGIVELTLEKSDLSSSMFAYCDGLRTVTLPIDYDFSEYPFDGTSGVTNINYTYGLSGVMKDRTLGNHDDSLEYASRNSITKVEFEEGITHIGDYAYYCIGTDDIPTLTTISLPSTLESIGSYAFYDCDDLTSMHIPDSTINIGSWAFYDCDGIKELTLPDTKVSLGEGAFCDCDGLKIVTLPVDYDFSNAPFCGTSNVTTIHYTYGTSGIMMDRTNVNYGSTLEYNSRESIQEIEFEEGITNIGEFMFFGGDDESYVLSTIKLPSTLESIGGFAFCNCNQLDSVFFCGSAPVIADSAFWSWYDNVPITCYYPGNDASWTEEVLLNYGGTITWSCYCTNNHSYEKVVTVPTCTEQGYTTYTCSVCGNCYSDDYVDVVEHIYQDGVCSICGHIGVKTVASGYSGYTTWFMSEDGVLTFYGEGAMKNYTYKSEMPWYTYMDQITSVVLEEGVTRIGNYAFYGMTNLKSVSIPESVTTIGTYAFKNSTTLNDVVLPSDLTKLGESAFYGCTALTSIDIPASLWTVQPYTFKNCTALAEVTFHEGNLQKISDAAFYGTALTEVTLPDCLDILDVYTFKNCTNLKNVKLSESMTQIREAAFYGTAIRTIEIPEGITSIGAYAFKNCTNLVKVQMPTSLTDIGEASFYNCNKLETLVMPDNVTSVGNYAFKKCATLQEVQFANNLVSIGESSFYGCAALTEIVIPENAATVGEYCFSRNTGLTKITFTGNAPSIGSGAFSKVTGDVYYPVDNTTWTSEVMQNYGGTLNWVNITNVWIEEAADVVETKEDTVGEVVAEESTEETIATESTEEAVTEENTEGGLVIEASMDEDAAEESVDDMLESEETPEEIAGTEEEETVDEETLVIEGNEVIVEHNEIEYIQ